MTSAGHPMSSIEGQVGSPRPRLLTNLILACSALAFTVLADVPATAEPAKQATAPAATKAPETEKPDIADPQPEGVRINEAGVFANYFRAPGPGKHPAIIELGGSEGGLGRASVREAKALQAHGFNVLQLGYFAVPGQPDQGMNYWRAPVDVIMDGWRQDISLSALHSRSRSPRYSCWI